jgi:hypothetical protein
MEIGHAAGLLKNPSESVDGPRTSGRGVEIIEINPFRLRLSKHEYLFLTGG